MVAENWLTSQFEAHRAHLRAVAYRMLGSHAEADDAMQEAWLRVSRADTSDVVNPGGWLTTVVGRVCLTMLQSRKSRREEPLEVVPERATAAGPEQEAELADSVGLALLVVLDQLAPAERLAFVLHDLFAVPFDQIAPIVDRTPAAARQLASRARRRMQGADTAPDVSRQREVVEAFLAASRDGDFAGLLALLDPDIVLRADAATVQTGATAEVRGADAVAETFSGRARAARPALIDGEPGAVWSVRGTPRVVFAFTIADGRIVAIEMLSDPEMLAELEITR
ncbi:MAG: sigma-70 family RNA polymerase sigma factor [Actinophytocola sp.]|uniref:sigma-70 family RNA polymerase sigma factor n=1 Tax=Actinophytocola sp. TaxID=1872138 RepID=UPI0013297EBE|nr:sigma-70 family RNA polymerase sigma factor [Actinophytocola sp.]MPZ80443.1 sigma-70 family RNA polymerase sigma factor [Actinophytocola sp.]